MIGHLVKKNTPDDWGALARGEETPDALIEINTAIMRGLREKAVAA